MGKLLAKEFKRNLRHTRLRKKLSGTPAQPRLCVHRSLKNLEAQVIDDSSGKVLFGMSTLAKEMRTKMKSGGNVKAAEEFGKAFAAEATKRGIKKICFDRGGYVYHGRVKAFADALRKSGMEF